MPRKAAASQRFRVKSKELDIEKRGDEIILRE
jgi:hypothetical protein